MKGTIRALKELNEIMLKYKKELREEIGNYNSPWNFKEKDLLVDITTLLDMILTQYYSHFLYNGEESSTYLKIKKRLMKELEEWNERHITLRIALKL